MEGIRINNSATIEAQGHSIENVVMWAARAFLHMLLSNNLFHCDPHPGNLLVTSEGRIVLLDFGMHQRVDATFIKRFERM